MRIVAINPNSTAAMTESIAAGISRTLTGTAKCLGISNKDAPPAIQGAEDGAKAVPGVLRIIRETPADGFVIACFDDTGLDEARLESSKPVIGIGQAAYHMAALLSTRFAVITTLPVSVPVIEGNIERLGFANCCAGVYASGVPVLELERDPVGSLEKVSRSISDIKRASPDCSIILGCAGMGILKNALAARHSSLIVDPVECAGRLIPMLIAANKR
jgi:allantoin racemase